MRAETDSRSASVGIMPTDKRVPSAQANAAEHAETALYARANTVGASDGLRSGRLENREATGVAKPPRPDMEVGKEMDGRLTFERIPVGGSWTSPARTITEADVVTFANTTGDRNPLHVDYEFAKSTPFRQPIAHGLLGLSWVAGLGSHTPLVDTVAFVAIRNWEFLRPLFFGDTVHVRTTVLEKQANARRTGRVLWQQELINQNGEVTQQGVFETLVRVEQSGQRPHFSQSRPASRSVDSQ